MTDMGELLQVVDENNQEIGAATKEEVWREGLIHRVVQIMVFSPDGKFLVQRRGDKPLYPRRWDVGVAGHVSAGWADQDMAALEAEQEIGVTGLDLRVVGRAYQESEFEAESPVGRIIMKKFATTYETTLQELPTKLGKGEVVGVAWWNVTQVKRFVEAHPDLVTDSLAYVAQHYLPD